MSNASTASGAGWEPPTPEELQTMLPQYEISGFLGRGGMGAVYRAKQIRLDRDVAIKVLPETLTQGGDDELKFAERFELEAQAMAKFSHSSIVSVFDFGETSEGQLYFVMEFVEGMDIHQYLRENGGSISQEYALSITAHVLDALEYAHARGIIHRDIKPANILLNQEGQVKIADFGLAKVLSDGDEQDKPALTMSNVALGTPDFVAPEAIDGDGIPDHRADLYAVGVMLYQMLTGKIPRGQFPSPSELLPDLDPRVDDIVQQSMQYSPSDRYDTASSMRMALDPVISAPVSRVKTIQKSETPTPKAKSKIASKHVKKKESSIAGKVYLAATVCAVVATLFFVFGKKGEPTNISTGDEVVAQDPETRDEVKSAETEKGNATLVSTSVSNEAGVKTPFENSLGMRFVPVPITGGPSDGKLILFSAWETRVSDYRAFADANPSIIIRPPRFPQDDSHPAVRIPYEDAVAFCEWLTKTEKEKGNLVDGQNYRLPTDHEWSCAIGIGEMEDPNATPAAKRQALGRIFPWGDTWPPPNGTANWYGEENEGLGPGGKPKKVLKGYSDDFLFTAPVDSMPKGKFGLYHMFGNAWEWTSDWYDETRTLRATRSMGWVNVPNSYFLSSRESAATNSIGDGLGFRAVLDLNQEASENRSDTMATSTLQKSTSAPPSQLATVVIEEGVDKSLPPSSSSIEAPFENSLGMKFVPVPITGGPSDGQLILFSIWETRVKDYRAFTDANPEIKQGNVRFPQEDSHPALYINYENAVAFCEWLTDTEKAKGKLSDGQHYRLPSDHEWSCAIGIGELEDPLATPKSKDKALERLWPWGNTWPPPNNTINCYGEENAGLGLHGKPKDHLRNYSDESRYTAPVDSMATGKFGLYHMSGNVAEWTSTWHDESKSRRSVRGSTWLNVPGGFYMSSARSFPAVVASSESIGMRVVLDLDQKVPDIDPASANTPISGKSPQDNNSAAVAKMNETPIVSPLASIPGLESRLVKYLQYRQKLIADLSGKYLSALDGRFESAVAAGDLTLAKAFEAEKISVEKLPSLLLELDKDPFTSIASSSTLDTLPADTPQGLTELRAIWTAERSKISATLSTSLAKSLKALEVELTKAIDLENATKVRNLMESLATEPASASSPQPSIQSADIASPPTAPFENSIGMKFLPVEVDGSHILLSMYETTVDEYSRFIRDDRNRNWPEPPWRVHDDQAAVMLNWDDANAFCAWLTEEERKKNKIGEGDKYTLPSLLELKFAAGVVESFDRDTGKITYRSQYLWGNDWPIPGTPGNFFGEENRGNLGSRKTPIPGYNDGFPQIAEVGSFEPNSLGFYDLLGNAWEWCEDSAADRADNKTLYGASSMSSEERTLKADFNNYAAPTLRSTAYGLRIVLRRSGDSP